MVATTQLACGSRRQHKAWGERSGTPGNGCGLRNRAHDVGDSRCDRSGLAYMDDLYLAAHVVTVPAAARFAGSNECTPEPGVALRSTPGSMLPPASQAEERRSSSFTVSRPSSCRRLRRQPPKGHQAQPPPPSLFSESPRRALFLPPALRLA